MSSIDIRKIGIRSGGIGMTADDPDARNPEKWKGENLLGKIKVKYRRKVQGTVTIRRQNNGKYRCYSKFRGSD